MALIIQSGGTAYLKVESVMDQWLLMGLILGLKLLPDHLVEPKPFKNPTGSLNHDVKLSLAYIVMQQ